MTKQIIVTTSGAVYLRLDNTVKRIPTNDREFPMDNTWREFFGAEPEVGSRWNLVFNDIEFPDRLSSSLVLSINEVPE